MYLLMTTDQFERATKKYPFGALLSSPQWTRARWDTELAKGRVIVQGDTIEEAAKKIGVDPKGLLEQVAEWNQTVASGRDLKFGRTKFAGKFEGTHFFMAPKSMSGSASRWEASRWINTSRCWGGMISR